ncbi:DUF4185 domain-containing protein [uncultured Aeromicrobium sp.]|uniref:DUF4185 domain-containing protein n=1 Tax=uncultured Aeromicrobium sp. TaxID=337820 RepID=UPI002600AF41|nr:DUF4185 domain-containing protein [uncultured Aeromicrobium sp.]
MAIRTRTLTGPAETGAWGCGATDLGILRDLGNGRVLAVFGDTFDGDRVGVGAWRSPVGLRGTIGGDGLPVFDQAAGTDPRWARQFWDYPHNNPTFSTVLPSDVVRLPDGALVLHVMVNKGLGNVVWTELWRSTDNGTTWGHAGFTMDAGWDGGKRQLWTMEYNPADGYVYVMSTGFQRDKGIILWRSRWDRMWQLGEWQPWTFKNGRWQWGQVGDVPGEIVGGKWGELNLRIVDGTWCLTGFDAAAGQIVTHVLRDGPTSDFRYMPRVVHAQNGPWEADGLLNICAQPYGGYVVPGSRLGVDGGFKVVVSQWNTHASAAGPEGWPYRCLGYSGRVNR